ncbi:MAG: hypothetical protein HY670_05120 [Chloroflexi bacterium]|nr:hypothetical protein [Chloroflexota bacterium]
MKQHNMNVSGQLVLGDYPVSKRAFPKRAMSVLWWTLPGLALLAAVIYLFVSGVFASSPVDPAAMSAEQTLGADYVMQTDFLLGRYLLPLLVGLLSIGAVLFYVLRVKVKGQA